MAMMQAAAEAVGGRAKLIAVTILTSLSDDDIWAAGFDAQTGYGRPCRRACEACQSRRARRRCLQLP